MIRWLALTAILLLPACTGDEDSITRRLFPLARNAVLGDGEDAPPPAVEPSREQLNQIPFATIAFSYGELPAIYIIPLADNRGYLTYQDENQRGIVMLGGAVAGTRGLGADLYAVRYAQDDPVANRTPLADWPRVIARSYQYRVRDLDDYIVTVQCRLEPTERVGYEIAEIVFNTVRVIETCSNARRQFTNRYWVADDGFIWASEQWLGPNLQRAKIEIVRPYGG